MSSWLTPGRLLFLFCAMNMLVYIDRGIIASNGVNGDKASQRRAAYGIVGEFDLSLTQDGFLATAFMVGLLVSAPLFAEASKHYPALRLMAVGLAAWILSTAGCAFTIGYYSMLTCRMVVGLGEASFVSLASPLIDDSAPPARKSRWLATFYLCIPVGYAAGYILGGVIAPALGWRAAFLLEAAAMMPFAVFCAVGPALDLKGKQHHTGPVNSNSELGTSFGEKLQRGVASALVDLKTLAKHPVYVLNVAATAVYTGVVGTILGGVALDRVGSTMRNALTICCISNVLGALLLVASFAAASSFAMFVPYFAVGQLALFSIQAPSNAVALWSVPPLLRPFGMAILIICIHLGGDVPSPPALGWLQSKLDNWRLSMPVCSLFLLLAAAICAAGAVLACREPDYRDEQQLSADNTTPDSDELGSADESAHLPLLTEPETSERTPLHSEDV
ncbi:MAG: sugar transporter spinster transmembrane [Trebouxia sp. A1-2]|nr:MAG: sugar transporter spinster transmembrane [Trebouxia sp. A1-2]